MAAPPSSAGAVHESDTWAFPGIAVRPVGGSGTVEMVVKANGIAETLDD